MYELQGRRVVVTRPRKDFPAFARLLQGQGATPISLPTIEIRPSMEAELLTSTLEKLHRFNWLIVTSANAVRVLGEYLTNNALPRPLRLAAIGPKTANALRRRGWKVDFVPDKYVAEAILPGLGNVNGQHLLLARGDLANPDLPEGIRAAGGEVIDLVVYRTQPVSPDPQGVEQIRRGVNVLTFTSSSSTRNFVSLMQLAHLDPSNLPGSPIYAYIGPVTAATAQEFGLPNGVVAEVHTLEGIVDSLSRFYSHEGFNF